MGGYICAIEYSFKYLIKCFGIHYLIKCVRFCNAISGPLLPSTSLLSLSHLVIAFTKCYYVGTVGWLFALPEHGQALEDVTSLWSTLFASTLSS